MASRVGQHRPGRRPARGGRLAARAALRADLGPLPAGPGVHAGVAHGRGGRDRAARRARRWRSMRTPRTRADAADLPASPRRGAAPVRGRARRRPERLGRAGGALRPRARAEPADRRPIALDCRRGAGARRCCGTSTACSRSCRTRRADLPGGRRRSARRARGGARRPRLGARPIGCATSSPSSASRSRTRATASAGGAWRPSDDRRAAPRHGGTGDRRVAMAAASRTADRRPGRWPAVARRRAASRRRRLPAAGGPRPGGSGRSGRGAASRPGFRATAGRAPVDSDAEGGRPAASRPAGRRGPATGRRTARPARSGRPRSAARARAADRPAARRRRRAGPRPGGPRHATGSRCRPRPWTRPGSPPLRPTPSPGDRAFGPRPRPRRGADRPTAAARRPRAHRAWPAVRRRAGPVRAPGLRRRRSRRARSSSLAAARSRRRSRPAGRLAGCSSRRSVARRWRRIVLHATTLRIPIVEVEGGSLTSLAGFDGHQGVARRRRCAALRVGRRHPRPRPSSAASRRSSSCSTRSRTRRTSGTLLRSAEAAGVHGVVFPDGAPGAAVARRGQGLRRRDGAPPPRCRSTISPGR